MTPVKFAMLHDTVFIGGKNFDIKLDPERYTGIKMEYDEDAQELQVTWNNQTLAMTNNVKGIVRGEFVSKRLQQVSHPMNVEAIKGAQVETPYGHVHAGPGKGKTK